MSRAHVEIDDQTLARAESLARQRGVTVEQLLAKLIEQASKLPGGGHQVLGLFADEPNLMDQVAEDALRSREEQPLRLPHG